MTPKPVTVRNNAKSSKGFKGYTDRNESTMKSTLTQENVNKLLKMYHISSFSALAAGDVPANDPPDKHILVYEHTLSNGLYFPLSSFISSTLGKLGVPIGLLPPNAIRMLVGFELLCFYHDIPCDHRHFLQIFRIVRAGNHFYFSHRSKSPRIYCKAPDVHKGWKDDFFFLGYDMGTYPEKALNHENLENNQCDTENADVHAKFQVSRVLDLSKGWDNSLVRNYLKLAQESVFSEFTWSSASDRSRALNDWKKAFEQRSLSRKEFEKIVDEAKVVDGATVRPVGKRVGETYAEKSSSTEGEEDFSDDNYYQHVRKRHISEEGASEEPAPTRAKSQSCSNFSKHDVEGQTIELDGVSGERMSGGLAEAPVIPLSKNYLSQNMLTVGEGPPRDVTSLAADIGKITDRFVSSAKEQEEKLVQLKEALDKKTAECQEWEEKFNISQKEHEQKEEEYEKKLKKCLSEHMRALSKQKEYEKLLKEQNSDFTSLKEQKEEMDTTLNEVKVAFDSIFTQCMNGLTYIENAKSLQRK